MKSGALITLLFYSLTTYAAGGEHNAEHIPLAQIGWQAANLGVLLGLIFFFVRKSIIETFKNRKEEYLQRAEKTKSALKEAEAALLGIKEKLAELEAGEKKSVERAQHEANILKASLIKEAEAGAEKIKNEATMAIKNELNKAKAEINSEILNHAVASAKKTLSEKNQASASAQQASFVKQLEQVKA